MTTLNFPSLLGSSNIRAFLRLIRVGESNNEDDGPHSGYRAMYHPTERRFYDGPLEGPHPRVYELLPDGSGRKSSAFGAYQFVYTTWEAIGRKYGLADDIKPYNQDCYAVALLYDCGALEYVIDGKLAEALAKAGTQWASLPDSPLEDGGRKLTFAGAQAVWRDFGGATVTYTKPRDPAPAEPEEPMAFPLLAALPLISSLIEAFSPIARAKVQGALGKQGLDANTSGAVADSLMGIVKQLAAQGLGVTVGPAGAPLGVAAQPQPVADPIVAVATVKQNPTLLAQAEAQFVDYFDKLAPVMDRMEKLEQGAWAASEESMDRAANRAAPPPEDWMARALVAGILIGSGVLLLFLCGVAVVQIVMLETHTPTTEVWAAITGAVGSIFGILGTVFAFKFGSTRSSQTKDFAIAELSARKQ